MSPPRSGPRARTAARVLGLAGVLLVSACARPGPFLPLDPNAFVAAMHPSCPTTMSGRGVELHVARGASVWFDLARVRALELDVEADQALLVSYSSYEGGPVRTTGKRRVLPGASTLRLDFAEDFQWSAESRPALLVAGTGTLTLMGARAELAPDDPAAFDEYLDHLRRVGPEVVGHTTINYLRPALWSEARGTWLAPRIAWASLAAVVLIAFLARGRRRLRLGVLVACASGLAFVGMDAWLLLRIVPAFGFGLELDPEARVRDHYVLSPDAGALAALARATLRPDERVGVACVPNDWAAYEALCFQLAPRRCVIVNPGATADASAEHLGLSGVERLRTDELDALVVLDAPEVPAGFEPVARLREGAYVARRR